MQFTFTPDGIYTAYSIGNEQNRLTVIPAFGAVLNELVLDGQSVVEGYANHEEMDKLYYSKGAKLSPFPNRIRDGRFDFEGKTYQFPLNKANENNAIHGFVSRAHFELINQEVSEEQSSMTFQHEYKGQYDYFPFPYTLTLTYTLTNSGEFTATTRVVNTSGTRMPYGDGWHPYFTLGGQADTWRLQLPSTKALVTDDRMLPTGEMTTIDQFTSLNTIGDFQFDTGFAIEVTGHKAVTILENATKRLSVWQNTGDKGFNFVQIFIPPWRSCIAVEPMTCAANAFNSGLGLFTLEANEIWEATYGVICDNIL